MTERGLDVAFRLVLLCMPLAAALGSFVTVAGIAPARPVGVLLVALALLRLRGTPSPQSVVTVVLALAWVGWGFFQPYSHAGFAELMSIGLGLMTVAAVTMEPASLRTLRAFAAGWGLAWVIACAPAVVEILTGARLPNYLEGSPEHIRLASQDIASFFVNPNLFAYFITLASFQLVALAGVAERRVVRMLMLLPAAITPVFVLYSGSRLALLVSPLVLVWALWAWWPKGRRALVTLGATALAVGGFVVLYSPRFWARMAVESQGSTQGRLNLYRSGVHLWTDSFGFGVGAGRFETEIARGAAPYDTQGAINPHAGIFELMSQYGLLPTAIAIACLVVVVWPRLKAFAGGATQPTSLTVAEQSVCVSVVLMLVLSFANSTFLDSPIAWLHVASLSMMSVALSAGSFPTRVPPESASEPWASRPQLRAYAASLASRS